MSRVVANINDLNSYLADCPDVFLRAPMLLKNNEIDGEVSVGAVISDLLGIISGDFLNIEEVRKFYRVHNTKELNHYKLILIAARLLSHDVFVQAEVTKSEVMHLLENTIKKPAMLVDAEDFILDEERREELIRHCLNAFDILPESENKARAYDRLKAIDSVERDKVMHEAQKAHQRAKELREAMARKRAQEAASKMSRE